METGLEGKDVHKYLNVLASEGDFRMTVPESTEGAKKRTYETSDGKTGSKWEKVYKSIGGKITKVEFFEGDYGKNLLLTFDLLDGGDDVIVSLGAATPFGEDVMKKLPNIDFAEVVKLTPYSFEDDKKKLRRGISIIQEDKGWDKDKVLGAFYDPEKEENLLGFPDPDDEDTSGYDSDDWKMYFTKTRKFLVKYTEDNIIPKLDEIEATEDATEEEKEDDSF